MTTEPISVGHRQPVMAQTAKDHDRVYEIDLLRFLAAFSVVLFHYSFRGAAHAAFTTFGYPGIVKVSRYGYLGVNMFFMISGFVILMSAYGSTPKRFFISRFVRLFPAYWVCCSITFFIASLAGDPRFVNSIGQYVGNMTMLNGFTQAPFVDGVYWSLRAELQFYVFVFCLLAFRQTKRLEAFLAVWLLLSIVESVHHLVGLRELLVLKWAAYFVAGSTFYLVYLGGWNLYRSMLLFGSYVTVLRYAVIEAQKQMQDYGQPCNPWVVGGCVTFFFLIFLLIIAKKLRRFCSSKFVVLGAITYPLYLLHQNIGYLTFNQFQNRINRHALFWGMIVLMILAAALLHYFVERPGSRRLKRFLGGILGEADGSVKSKGRTGIFR